MQHTAKDIVIPSFDLTGKVAIVTGGTKGLGYGMALTLAKYGADVVVSSRNQSDCDRVAGEIREMGHRGLGVATDVKHVSQIDALIQKTADEMGRLDIVVCNAGTSSTAKALDMTEEQWDEVQTVDLKAVFFTARAAARQMIKQESGGRIINIASSAGIMGARGISHYCAAKAGVVNLTKALAIEWGRYGITVNAVCPGYVPTSLNEEALANPKVKEGLEKATVIGRLGTIEEICAPVLMLASDYSGYITGTHILADGGTGAQ